MRAGSLHEQIVIQRRAPTSPTKNNIGEDEYAWQDFYTCRARIRSLVGKEGVSSEAQESRVDTELQIRYYPGITAGMRAAWGSVYYDIRWVDNVMTGNAEIRLLCTQGNSNG